MSLPSDNTTPSAPGRSAWYGRMARLLLAAAVLAAAFAGYKKLLATAPRRSRRHVGERAVVVTTQRLRRQDKAVTIRATGTVVAARQLSVRPRVSGQVVEVNPNLEPGGVLRAGEMVVMLDKADFELALRQAQLGVAKAKTQLKEAEVGRTQADSQLVQAKNQLVEAQCSHTLELGRQDVARHEWEMLEDKDETTPLDHDLALRKPHLEQTLAQVATAKAAITIAEARIESAAAAVESAKAGLASAEATLEQARLNLERCRVEVPFDALVLKRGVSVGAQVTPQIELAQVAATDVFWVEATLPMDELGWIALPAKNQAGAKVVIHPAGADVDEATAWPGRVIRRLPALEPNGRRARILVEVPHPLTAGDKPLLLGTFVTVDIQGPVLKRVFEIPQECLRNGQEVWLRNAAGRLDIVPVRPLWGDARSVVVDKGLHEGQLLIVSNLAAAVPGMRVMLPEEAARRREAGQKEHPGGAPQGKGPGGGKAGKTSPQPGKAGRAGS